MTDKSAPQTSLFGDDEQWTQQWHGMPEFVQQNLMPFKTVYVHFDNFDDVRKFAELINQTITMETKSLWFPKADMAKVSNMRWVEPSADEILNDET
jgi:hypothetical protein